MAESKYHGCCLCEGITYKVARTPEKVFACYCIDCSKSSGGPCQILAKYDKAQVEVNDPQNLAKTWIVTKTLSGSEKHKVFCGRCGCTLWTIPQSHKGNKLIVRTSLFESGFQDLKPDAEFFAQSRPSFAPAYPGAKAFTTMPGH